ncbi:helix-turn-helix domain-containing protein [Aliihoeflea sp. PC F10.4]
MDDRFAYPPRGLSREAAARYIGVRVMTFDDMVQDGRMPRPKKLDCSIVWDRVAIDTAFTKLPETQSGNSAQAGRRDVDVQGKPRAYSPRTLAERWRCSDGHVRNMIDRGELTSFHLGKLLRISTEEVERYEANNMIYPNASKA